MSETSVMVDGGELIRGGGHRYGYVRVSTQGQNIRSQLRAIKNSPYRCERIFRDTATGVTFEGRQGWAQLLEVIQPGDEIVVHSIDRISRSIDEWVLMIMSLRKSDVALRTLVGNLYLDPHMTRDNNSYFGYFVAIFAQMERDGIRERQARGIALAKKEGKYTGRKPIASSRVEEIRQLAKLGMKNVDIAAKVGVHRQTVAKYLKEDPHVGKG